MSRKALLIATFVVAMAGRSYAGVFADVPFNHWAYQAVEKLAAAGVLEGYPDGKYRGPQAMTRYEFAVAVARAYDWIRKTIGVDPERIQSILDQIKAANGKIGDLATKEDADIRAVNGRIDGLSGKLTDEVKRLDGRIDGMGKGDDWTGKYNDLAGKLDQEVKDRKAGDDALQGQINDLKATHQRDTDATNNTVTGLNTRVGGLEGRTKALEDAVKALQALAVEFDRELKALGVDVAKLKTDLAALTGRVTALEGRVNDHERRITALERFKFYGDLAFSLGFDGSPSKTGAQDGDLRFESGEAWTNLSARLGVDIKVTDTVAGRATWWYDSDNNRFHGRPAGGRQGVMANLGIDEFWVKTPGLGGKWIFGRQYAGQDYDTGDAVYGLGLGTGYYTGAALNGVRAQYDFGKRIRLTGLIQADDNTASDIPLIGGIAGSGAANLATVVRADVHLPWLKDKAGKDGVSFGLQAVGSWPNNNVAAVPLAGAPVGVVTYKQFNDGSRSSEWGMSANAHINFLKGLDVEVTSQFQDSAGASGPDANGNGKAHAEVLYGKLGILKTPTFKLDVAAGYVGNDFSMSYSQIMNPYQTNAGGVEDQLFTRSLFLGSVVNQNVQGAPTQGVDVHLGWNIGHRPLNIRLTGSSRKADLFNWMVYGDYPIIQTGRGDVKVGLGYIDVDPGHPLGANTVAANVKAGFSF